ncbi:GNAT family N-acetyltransferase [Variibacter gotjawalensis]|nr:GNAT family N-acetyltransferase [Variibacter gotjawalensis]NIK50110.1 hypothetical protein [Variibacter gotjawalensis]
MRKDHRYYEVIEDSCNQGFEYRYLLVRGERGEEVAIQPCFVVDQDALEGLPARAKRWANWLRTLWPRFMRFKILMIGCAIGEGHLGTDEVSQQAFVVAMISRSLPALAKSFKASLVVWKEFPAKYREALGRLSAKDDYVRIPSFPNIKVSLDYANFDDFMQRHLSQNMRKHMRRKFRDAAKLAPIEMEQVVDVADVIDDVYRLYLNVYERSELHFEKLTPEFFLALSRRMPEKARFFVWRQNGKIVASALCLIEGDAIYTEYMGLDYEVALDAHLYFIVIRDIMNWAMARGFKNLCGTGMNYWPKYHLRMSLAPLDLYVRHRNPLINKLMKPFLRFLGPTRHDEVLPLFPNYKDIH